MGIVWVVFKRSEDFIQAKTIRVAVLSQCICLPSIARWLPPRSDSSV